MWEVEWEPEAVNAASLDLSDPQGLGALLTTIDQLRADPFSVPAFELGHPNRRRIRSGPYRVIMSISLTPKGPGPPSAASINGRLTKPGGARGP